MVILDSWYSLEKMSWNEDWKSPATCATGTFSHCCIQTMFGGQQYSCQYCFGVTGNNPKIMAMNAGLCNWFSGFVG